MASAAAGEARSGDGGARLGREGGGDRRLGSAQRARQAAATGISTHAEPSGEALQLSALRLTDERHDVPVAAARSAGGRGGGAEAGSWPAAAAAAGAARAATGHVDSSTTFEPAGDLTVERTADWATCLDIIKAAWVSYKHNMSDGRHESGCDDRNISDIYTL